MDQIILQPQDMPKQKTFTPKFIAVLVLLLVLGSGAAAGVWYWQTSQVPATVEVPVHKEKVDPLAGWQSYANIQFGFEFKYPPTWAKVIDTQASLSDYLSADGTRSFVAIFPLSYPAQDFSARVDVYPVSLETVKKDNPPLKGKQSSSVTVNNISWTQIQITDSSGNPIDSFEYLTEMNGKTYDVGGSGDLTKQILSTFKFTAPATIDPGSSGNPAPTPSPTPTTTPTPNPNKPTSCAQVITTARNPKTGETRDFPTPCDVPPGWIVVGPPMAN